MSEIMDRLGELEKRVAGLKDWKEKYFKDKEDWDRKREELEKALKESNEIRAALARWLAPFQPVGTGQKTGINANLEETQLSVNLSHQEKQVNMTTGTVIGKILYCALTELSKEGFSESELTVALKERGWNVGHSTLAPSLGGLVRDGYLIKLAGTRPSKYRLPVKLKMNIQPI